MTQKIGYYKMPYTNIDELIYFVVNENHLHHCDTITAKEMNTARQMLYEEEKQYINSNIFIAMSNNIICGSIRILQRKPNQILPLEKIFNINLDDLASGGTPIYHIGRFAVSKGADKKGFHIFKTLIALSLQVAHKDHEGIVFAECDVKLLRTIRLLGIAAEQIGEHVLYLGSETVPIKLPWASYQIFLDKNKNLLGSELPMFSRSLMI